MLFAHIKNQPELVLTKICDGYCVYPNLAAMAYHFATNHEDFGMVDVSDALVGQLDKIYSGSIKPAEVMPIIEGLFPGDCCADTKIRAMFRYALDVDQLLNGRMNEISPDRRRQFVAMTFDMAENGVFPASHWADHFLGSAIAAE